MQIVPPQILSYQYKKEHSVALKIRQNPFLAGALPRTPVGELTTLPRTPSRLGRGHTPYPHPTRYQPTFGARHASFRIPARSTPVMAVLLVALMHWSDVPSNSPSTANDILSSKNLVFSLCSQTLKSTSHIHIIIMQLPMLVLYK